MKEGWEYKKLGEVCSVIRDGSHNPPKGVDVSEYLMLSSQNIFNDNITLENPRYLSKEDFYRENKRTNLKRNDVLLTIVGTVGRTCVYTGSDNITMQRSVAILTPKEIIMSRYLMFQLIFNTSKLNEKAHGIAQKGIYLNQLKNITIPVPPPPIQQQIVSHLDKLNEILDKLRATLNVLNKAEQAIFYDMFGDPVENEKGWGIKMVKDIASVVGGSTPKTNVEEYWNGDLNWITPAELDGSMYLNDTVRKITNKAVQKTNLTLLPVGTVILSSRAPIGKIAISNIPTYCNQGFKNIICSSHISNIFVYAYLKCRVDYLISLGRGATFKEISKTIVENIPIPLPPLSLQQTFAARISTIEIQKQKLTTSIAKFQEMLDGAMENYFGD